MLLHCEECNNVFKDINYEFCPYCGVKLQVIDELKELRIELSDLIYNDKVKSPILLYHGLSKYLVDMLKKKDFDYENLNEYKLLFDFILKEVYGEKLSKDIMIKLRKIKELKK